MIGFWHSTLKSSLEKITLQTTSKSDNYFGALAKQNVNKFQLKKILSDQKILDEIENRISKLERQVHNLRIVLRNMEIKTGNNSNCPKNCQLSNKKCRSSPELEKSPSKATTFFDASLMMPAIGDDLCCRQVCDIW